MVSSAPHRGTDPQEEAFLFAPEVGPSPKEEPPGHDVYRPPALKVLTVDDDPAFQNSLILALESFRFQGARVQILTACSAMDAARVLSTTPDVAVVLLDVVMETDDAGLRLVRSVREVLGNAEVRIVLVTGQPGMAPMEHTLSALDISDYWLKTDLKLDRLQGVLNSNLRTWSQIRALGQARRGLQCIVEASNSLSRAGNLKEFSQRMMQELARLLQLDSEGLVCVQEDGLNPLPEAARIVGASGRLGFAVNQPLALLPDEAVRNLLVSALTQRRNVETGTRQVLFFGGAEHGPHAATYLATGRPLDSTERELLHVFATNINSGLINVALTSRLDRTAYEDPLLAMPNGNALLRTLEQVLEVPAPRDRALLFVELDQYSASCLSLGIEQGDLMLQKMARRLSAVFPAPTVVARLYDDTFAILGHSSLLLQERIDDLETLDPDASVHPAFISVRAARIDLDCFQGSARSAMAMGTLLLRRAQSQGTQEMIEYTPGLERETDQRFTRSRELYHALHGNEISIELQPQIELNTGRIVSAEALARWTRPDGTRIPPTDFIPMAEANGLIVPMGRQVLHLACQALVQLQGDGIEDLSIAVNVSPLQMAHRDFVQEFIAIVRDHGVAPERLEVEITETAAIRDYESNGRALRVLRDAGISIAIDDFGTGYSSLAHLRSMPAQTLKLDRCFTHEIGVVPGDLMVADMIVDLGRRFHMRVLAEGVETQAQADWLRARGCHMAQGYLFARPEPLERFRSRMRGVRAGA
ncbi:EAL domain-containing protein [Paracidovorax wautersii]|uniref:EAL domain-containing protein (Putative c-di-GMP-specific phosphodiesterase class I)/GGDEF domain-containing protein/CheY-like chemotaxis protein n=1 Tax=Paracidovorax wautersii TaxID=1177982 RepID=A0ABU1IDY1_9BURK|nr:EAL domain-containing protein [Paracidovorax wautersii]MDR6215437.1 EAL domain-containing protein (putative c-di-GMP-specific phosphodiesterase class I)/GGDEF domain-containing protein/CheY-like chemotaxis protein [Paracidovorax wautersii]